jgi:hypothetical protein
VNTDLAPNRDREHNLARARDQARVIDQALGLARTRDRNLGLARAHDRARDVIQYLGRGPDLNLARGPDRALARAVEDARTHASALASDWDLTSAHDRALALARALDCALDCARNLDRTRLEQADHSQVDHGEDTTLHSEGSEPDVTRVSRRLTAWAVYVLPAADQAHYRELFASELYDLALAGCSWRAQLAYAVHVLVRAVPLRWELRAEAPAVREPTW